MRLKSFHGPTLADAMRQIREALGDDAIIVATRDDETGGVRVTAAIDDPPSVDPVYQVQPAVKSSENGQTASDTIETIASALVRHCVHLSLSERLVASATQQATDDPQAALAAALGVHVPFAKLPDGKGGKPMVFVGPPGAGKTVNTARMATMATLGKKPVAVISADSERAGGMEQLAAFTRLLNTDMVEACDSHALREAVQMQTKEKIVLVDMPGVNPFDTVAMDGLKRLVTAANGSVLLVLPADLDSVDIGDIVKSFAAAGAGAILATRLDMTRRLGGLLRAAFETRMPLAAFASSAKVSEPVREFSPDALARAILGKKSGGGK